MVTLHERCLRCGRKLLTEDSKILGFGKVCWEKFNNEDNFQELFPIKCLTNNPDKSVKVCKGSNLCQNQTAQ